jgi:hypothetical protein
VNAEIVTFFNSSQVAETIESGVTYDIISSNGYVFTHTLDKLFTGGTGMVIGRTVAVPWPLGVTAQAVTTPPPGVTDHKARIDLRRVDGEVFDINSFTAKVLARTSPPGAAIEIMPLLIDGEDAFNDPVQFDVSGYGGQSFSYDETPNVFGSTASLKGFDRYKINLFVDFAFTELTLNGPPTSAVPEPTSSAFIGFGTLAAYLFKRRRWQR